jgi:predicted nucleotidyltransferase
MNQDFGITEKGRKILTEIFGRYPEVSKVLVFGSRAKGTFGERSDLDMVVIDPIDRRTLGSLWMDINESDLPFTVDLQVWNAIRNENLKEHINRVGKIIYAKSPESVLE